MKYQVGDKIIVLHSDEEGKVVDIINENMVMIEVRGVRFPAYMDQIDFPYFKMFTQQRKAPAEKKKIYVEHVKKEKQPARKKVKDGVELNFIPVYDKDIFDDDVVEKLRVNLVNHNEDAYSFSYELNFGDEPHFTHSNILHPLSDFYLHDVSLEDMNDGPRFDIVFELQRPVKGKAPYHETSLKLKPKQLVKKLENLRLNNEASFSFVLFEHYPDKEPEQRLDLSKLSKGDFRFYDAGKAKEYATPARSVVDLHIEKLTDTYRLMSPQDMLTLQLSTFEKFYDLAVLHHQPSLIIIHGVGEGRLRDEIHHRLRNKTEVTSFVNRYHPQFGWGATEISFK